MKFTQTLIGSLRPLAKKAFQHSVAGVSPLLYSVRTKKLILAYHEIVADNPGPGLIRQSMQIPLDRLERQLIWLKKFSTIVDLPSLVWEKNQVAGRAGNLWQVAVTFDDAYKSVQTLGMPLFERHNIPITIFVASSFVADPHRLPWWDLLSEVVSNCSGRFEGYDLDNGVDRMRFEIEMCQKFYTLSPMETELLYQRLVHQATKQLELPPNRIMNPDQLSKCHRSGLVTLGNHTADHISLGRRTPVEALVKNLNKCTNDLFKWTGHRPSLFAFPYGKAAFRQDGCSTLLRKAGIRLAMTTDPGYVNPDADPMALCRISVNGAWDINAFKSHILVSDIYQYKRA